MITAETLREIMDYEPETGLFRWRDTFAAGVCCARRVGHKHRKPGMPGDVVHTIVQKHGYVVIGLFGKIYYAHRLAWLHMHGAFPAKGLSIDHINGEPADNRLCNLRVGTHAQNHANTRLIRANNTTGYRGVTYALNGRYRASVQCKGVVHNSPTYADPKDAAAWRDAMAEKLHGGFARLNGKGA
jgi:HNH endonuclease